jgi:hypothetical protein
MFLLNIIFAIRRKKQNISFLSCWHMDKGRAKVGSAMVHLATDQPQRDGYNGGYFKVLLLARAGVKPQK